MKVNIYGKREAPDALSQLILQLKSLPARVEGLKIFHEAAEVPIFNELNSFYLENFNFFADVYVGENWEVTHFELTFTQTHSRARDPFFPETMPRLIAVLDKLLTDIKAHPQMLISDAIEITKNALQENP